MTPPPFLTRFRIQVLIALAWLPNSAKIFSQEGTFKFTSNRQSWTGAILAADRTKIMVINGYGQLLQLKRNEIVTSTKKSGKRQIYSRQSFHKRLEREFGKRFQVSSTDDFVVVHPQGANREWPGTIQQMHNRFESYFESRRIPIQKSDYPMVVLVFPNRSEFESYAQNQNETVTSLMIGYYSTRSNRVAIFDRSETSRLSEADLETIIHETCHQSAFNCGLHSRFGESPRWVVEGLGTLFEAEGVWNGSKHPQRSKRLNRRLYPIFQTQILEQKESGWIGDLVTGNRLFSKSPIKAYAAAWGLTFFLSETQPYRYGDYLETISNLPQFNSYSQSKRIRDFERHFGEMDRLEPVVRNYFENQIAKKKKQ